MPVVLLRLWLRGRRVPAYRRHWAERFALQPAPVRDALWLHAVSVGEVRALAPLIDALRRRYPQRPVLLTVTTPGGRETAHALYGGQLVCRYLPYDLPGAVRRFVAGVRPVTAIVAEVEIWPNLFATLQARGVPLYLVNARLSEKSLRRYRRSGGLASAALRCVRHVAAQSETDAARFRRLGVAEHDITVTGNLKYAAVLPGDLDSQAERLRRRLSGRRPVWVAASTHEGEEAGVLRAHAEVLRHYPQAVLLLAPRHPERAGELARECARMALECRLYSEPCEGAAVVIVDRLGVLLYCYAVADVAFMGGSLVARGGHNPVEALLAGVPVLSGAHLENFSGLYAQLQTRGAARVVAESDELAQQLRLWFDDPGARERAVEAGRGVFEHARSVVDRVLDVVAPADGVNAVSPD